MFEHKSKPLAPKNIFINRVMKNFFISLVILVPSLLLGVFGYHITAGLGWTDSLLNASMILTGMGPVDPMVTQGAKLFASFYALFSGVVFLTTIAVMMAPVLHRFMHKMHLQDK